MDGKYFESLTEGIYTPGIQIRNLKKDFKISLLNNTVRFTFNFQILFINETNKVIH